MVVQKGPVAANQSMLQQIQGLQRENVRLQNARSGTPGATTSATPPPSYRRPKDRHNTTTTEVPDNTIRSLEDCWQSRRMEEAGSDQELEPVQEEARDDDAQVSPVLISRHQVSRIRHSLTLWRQCRHLKEQIRYLFLMSVNLTTTRWPPSMHGFLIALARRRCPRFGQPVMNCPQL